jgi:hypothetical protein
MGISSITGTSMATVTKWTCSNTQVGSNPIGTSYTINKVQQFGTSNPNNASGGGDEVFSFQLGISAASSATVDLNAMTNQLAQSAVSIARIKCWQIQTLSASDDATLSPAPNANSTATITNIGPANPSSLDFGSNGSGLTLDLTVVAGAINVPSINTAGSGYLKSSAFLVSPAQNSASGGAIAVVTNSAGIPTSVQLVTNSAGSGYTNSANVPAVELGKYNVLTGGCHTYFDPKAAGFCVISAVSKNVKIQNNDSVNAVTLQITAFGATT